MVYLSNAFSISMLKEFPAEIKIAEISEQTVREMLASGNFVSAVGHQATADTLSQRLQTSVAMNRIAIKINSGDILIVAQIMQRLEEGKVLTSEELQQLQIKFFKVEII